MFNNKYIGAIPRGSIQVLQQTHLANNYSPNIWGEYKFLLFSFFELHINNYTHNIEHMELI